MTLTIGSLCSGYEGLGMAVESVFPDTRLAWVSDIDKGACKVLAHRYPDVPNIGDMTAADWAQVESVDVLTGGTPCQDLSHAGKRAGMTEGTRSNLWVAMREAIATIRPSLVIWENVGGAYSAAAESQPQTKVTVRKRGRSAHRTVVGGEGLLAPANGGPSLRALGRVLGDLASLGYVGGWHGLRAADVGAPHGRLRVFVVATNAASDPGWLLDRNDGAAPDARGLGGIEALEHDGRRSPAVDRAGVPDESDRDVVRTGSERALLPSPRTSDTNGAGQHGDGGLDLRTAVSLLPTPAVNDMGASYTPDEWDSWTARMKAAHGNGNGHGASLSIEAQRLLPTPRVTQAGYADDGRGGKSLDVEARTAQWGQYAAAIARWEAITRPAPPPTETGPKGNPRLSPAFTEWMMGLPAGWITDVPGVTRNEALKLCGNGVVPQQAATAIRFLLGVIARQGVAA